MPVMLRADPKRGLSRDPRKLTRFDATGEPHALREQIGSVLRTHRALMEKGELPTVHMLDPVGVEDQEALARYARLGGAWLAALTERLPPSERVRIEMEWVSPFASPGAERVSEEVAGKPLPESEGGDVQEFLQQPWFRLFSCGEAAWEVRLAEIWLRRTISTERLDALPGAAGHEWFWIGRYGGEYVRHRLVRTRMWWAVRLGAMAELYAERLRAEEPPNALRVHALHCEVADGVVSLRIELQPDLPLEPARVAPILRWLWPSERDWAAGAREGADPLPEACFEGWRPSTEPLAVAWQVPDEEEMQRIEAWAERVRRKTLWARLTNEWRALFRRPRVVLALLFVLCWFLVNVVLC